MGEDIDLNFSQTLLPVGELKIHTHITKIARISMFRNSFPQ